jgi:hypothetical protein
MFNYLSERLRKLWSTERGAALRPRVRPILEELENKLVPSSTWTTLDVFALKGNETAPPYSPVAHYPIIRAEKGAKIEFLITMTSDPDEALEKLRQHPPDVVLGPTGVALANQPLQFFAPPGLDIEAPAAVPDSAAGGLGGMLFNGWNTTPTVKATVTDKAPRLLVFGFNGLNWDGDEWVTVTIRAEGNAHLVHLPSLPGLP